MVVEEFVHGIVILSHNASSMENLDTLSKNVIIVLTQISLGSQIGQFLQTTMLLKKTGSMTAMLTTLELFSDDNRFLDLRATNHITNDLSNLNFGSEYRGRNKIYMGNGVGLMIAHFGFPSLCFSNSPEVFFFI